MTDVCAGSHQRNVAMGELGIVTLWVRAESELTALAQAKLMLTNRRYASIGRLQSYAETLGYDPLACATEEGQAAHRREDSVLASYDALKEQALAQADGLFEVWLGALDQHLVRQQKIA
jgi:hypothetical protein